MDGASGAGFAGSQRMEVWAYLPAIVIPLLGDLLADRPMSPPSGARPRRPKSFRLESLLDESRSRQTACVSRPETGAAVLLWAVRHTLTGICFPRPRTLPRLSASLWYCSASLKTLSATSGQLVW